MEKNTNVSIAGIAFMLENDGYKILKDYLVRIEVGYKDNPDGTEVLADIEARICELILNEQPAESVVPTSLITSIVDQLGLPDDIKTVGNQPIYNQEGNDNYCESKLPRRLYRSTDESKLGGVCGGLAAYFNVEPIIMRLLFLAPLIILPIVGSINMHLFRGLDNFFGSLFGVSVMLYFILWFALPKAKTARQKLEMRGEKITASSISKNFRDDFDDVSSSPKNERTASILGELVFVVGRITLFCIKAFALFFGMIFGIVILSLIVAAIAVVFDGGSNDIFVVGELMEIQGIDIGTLSVLVLLLAIVPLLIIGYLLLRVIFKLPAQKKTIAIVGGVWILILIYVSVLFINNFNNIKDSFESGKIENYLESKYDHESVRTERTIVSNDSIRIETVTIGDSTVTDTTKIQRFFR